MSAHPVCGRGRRACPPEEGDGPRGYDQRTLDQFSWAYEAHDRLLAGEDIREDDVPTWFWTYRPEHFDKGPVNKRLAKLYQLKGNPDFLYAQGSYDYFFAPGGKAIPTVVRKPSGLLTTVGIALPHATGRHLRAQQPAQRPTQEKQLPAPAENVVRERHGR